MQLIELDIKNFKRFTDTCIRFSRGLNLIGGPNESGKSTVHEAACNALFGRERGKAVENWNGGLCEVDLTYEAEGTIYRIERKLTEGDSRLGVITPDGMIDTVSAKEKVGKLLAEHLGISSRSVFDNTVSIKQTDISRPGVPEMEAVGGEIQRILTGTAHISAGEVRKRLEDRRDAIRGRARPANPREFDKISERLPKLAEELANARHAREHIQNLDEELDQLEAKIERDSARLGVLSDLLERHRKWLDLRKKEEESDAQHADVFSTMRRIKDTISELESIQHKLEGYADLVGKDDEIGDHLSKIDARRAELDGRLGELSAIGSAASSSGVQKSILLVTALFAVVGLGTGVWIDAKGYLLLIPALALAGMLAYRRYLSTASESKHLSDMADSARNELQQLAVEEQSILSYIDCRTAEQAWERIKTYRNLAARAHEQELTMNALLNGRKMQDWETQEANLARELSAVRTELEADFPGYAPTTEESESWRTECAALQLSVPAAEARLHEVRGSLEAERRNARNTADLEGEIEFLHRRKSELEFLHKAYEEAVSALNSVTQTVAEEYLPVLSERAADYMAWVTSGKYSSISITPSWEISLDCTDKSAVTPTALSIGTLDQLYLSLRIACGGLLSGGRKLPIIMDDPFASFDQQRLDNTLSLIGALAKEHQILLLTHDPYILEWARHAEQTRDFPCAVHELSDPGGPGE